MGLEEDHFDLNPLGAQIEPVLVPLVVPPLWPEPHSGHDVPLQKPSSLPLGWVSTPPPTVEHHVRLEDQRLAPTAKGTSGKDPDPKPWPPPAPKLPCISR